MVFELLFILFVLISIIALVTALVLAIRARWAAAKRLLKVLGASWIVYLAIVLVVSAATPRRIIAMNHDLCFDEMCFRVVQVQTSQELGPPSSPLRANGMFYVVTLRVSNHGRGRAQKEGGLRALLWVDGRKFGTSPAGQSAWDAAHPQNLALTTRVQAAQTFLSDQVFDVPAQAKDLGLLLSHGFTPGYFVIGECPLLHKPTILRLSP